MKQGNNTVVHGDCLAELRRLPSSSVDAVVTDPPAGISFMGKNWDGDKGGRDQWVAWLTEVMVECLRVLKPGGHALVWAIPRTSHWTTWSVESAGFEIRDVLTHLHGQGFPRSHDINKAMERAGHIDSSTWAGWGTALKPAREDWILARKPLEGTIAANVGVHNTGALNLEGCRIGTEAVSITNYKSTGAQGCISHGAGGSGGHAGRDYTIKQSIGRWPPNLLLSHNVECAAICADGCAVALLNEQSVGKARFFYTAKAAASERQLGCDELYWSLDSQEITKEEWEALPEEERRRGNIHTTVKSVELMRWLVRLVTPPGGLVLDPFAGSGTTGVACQAEGFRFTGIEMDAAHVRIMRARLEAAGGQKNISKKPRKARPRTAASAAPMGPSLFGSRTD